MFTHRQANDRVGRRVCAAEACLGVPSGTTGRVVKAEEVEAGYYDLVIEWNLPLRPTPLRDCFSKGEYERYLAEG